MSFPNSSFSLFNFPFWNSLLLLYIQWTLTQCKWFSKCFILIVTTLKWFIFIVLFISLIVSFSINLRTPCTWRNVMFKTFYVVNNNKWNIFSYSCIFINMVQVLSLIFHFQCNLWTGSNINRSNIFIEALFDQTAKSEDILHKTGIKIQNNNNNKYCSVTLEVFLWN